MGASTLSSRAIIGAFYDRLQIGAAPWVMDLSMLFNSDQESETYAWLGMAPQLREWIGGRHARAFRENGITIQNTHFEATVEVLLKDLRRDKTGQIRVRIDDMADRTNSHWASLLSTLIENGESTVCYDGQYFFDTDHSEGDSGTQSNDISVDISALPASVHGVTTAPSIEEMQQVILKGITQIQTLKDDEGEPLNETAQDFIVVGPSALGFAIRNALSMPAGTGVSEQRARIDGFMVRGAINPRLTWTEKVAVFRADGAVKPFIRQQETEPMLKVKAEGSDFEFDHDAHQYGVDAWRNVGYGYWQHACLVTMT